MQNKKQAQAIQYSQFDSDEWDAAALGVRIPEYDRTTKLSFRSIRQPWLKEAGKHFIRYSATTKSYASLKVYLSTLRHFSGFLAERQRFSAPGRLNRTLITEYLSYLAKGGYSATTRHQRLVLLRLFLETANLNGWLKTPPYLVRNEDIPRLSQPAPRFISEEVLAQLNRHLDFLPSPIARMVLVIQECGLRIGELVELPRYCIEQDQKGDWHLRHFDFKLKKERVKPISSNMAQIIQAQQAYIEEHLPSDFEYLFCANERGPNGCDAGGRPCIQPTPRVMYAKCFQRYLQQLVEEFEIRDATGRLWHFQSHQFRHTVGARMINSGVPPHIIQRYLGHESPEMTMRYAHIHDETLKRELAQYLSCKLVDVTGKAIKQADSALAERIDREWMKQNVLAQALPNGSCSRPLIKGPCPHANACLTCCDFRTSARFLPQHREQVKATERLIAAAEHHGWTRQAEMNKQVRQNLMVIISSLEGEND